MYLIHQALAYMREAVQSRGEFSLDAIADEAHAQFPILTAKGLERAFLENHARLGKL